MSTSTLLGQHREHVDTSERRLPTLLLVGGTDTHEPVHADLRAEHAVDVATVNGEDRAIEAQLDALGRVVEVQLPALPLGVLRVHAQQHLGPVLGLETALARNDRHDCVAVVELAREPGRDLELVDLFVQITKLLRDFGGEFLIVLCDGEVVGDLEVLDYRGDVRVRRNLVSQLRKLGHDRLCCGRILPEARGRAGFLEVGDFGTLRVDVQILAHASNPLAQVGYVRDSVLDHGDHLADCDGARLGARSVALLVLLAAAAWTRIVTADVRPRIVLVLHDGCDGTAGPSDSRRRRDGVG